MTFDSQAIYPQSSSENNHNLAFIDGALPDYQALIAGLEPNTMTYVLDPRGNELEQMSQILGQQTGVTGVHIFSHGDEGSLQFGGNYLNSTDLSQYTDDLQRWKQGLASGADVLFYGCNVAAGDEGKAFLQQIHQITGADVAASDDLTGNAAQGGDWDLEFTIGKIETQVPWEDSHLVAGYNDVLASPPSNINFANFSSISDLTLNGKAAQATNTQTNKVLRLTSATTFQAGSAFYKTPIGFDEDTSFNTHFQFQLSGGNGIGGGDGFTFMLENSSAGNKALGDLGSSLGYGNQELKGTNQIGKSLAIEFDAYKNGWDQNDNHVAVLLNGDVTSQKAVAVPTFQLNSGNLLDAWLDYNGLTNSLSVYVGTSTVKPSTALLTYNVDLTSVVGNQAYVGFSAGTGGLTNNHDIDNWAFSTSTNINFANFSSISNLTLNGKAAQATNTQTNKVLRLTSATTFQAGSAFYKTPIGFDEDTSFNTHFQFQLSGGNGIGGADGFTFMLQNSNAGNKALGDLGGSLGYGNQELKGTNQIGKSLAIEFDTHKNGWDQNDNHVAVLLNGDVISQKAVAVPTFQLNSGNLLDAWLDYNGLTNTLSVYVGTSTVKPSTALLTYNVALTSVVGNQAYVGFSAGTGGLTNNHDIENWNFSASNSASSNITSSLAFSESNYSVNERDKTITVTVNRTGSSNQEVSVNYATSDRTAKAGIDYTATGGILKFAKGQTSANITISVLDDQQLDPNLAFLLTLSNPIDAELGTQKTSVITLLDNDASAAANVTTQHNDNNRTGADLNEVLLNTSNVNDDKFGKLFTRPVDGQIYTQPLYLANVDIPNQGVHNVVYVATMHNTVYAFDADDPNASTPLWSISLGPSVKLPDVNIGPYPNYRDITTEVGVLSTPVISTATNTLYVVAFTKESGNYIYRLHALDLKTGAEKFGGPVVLSGSVPGTSSTASVNGVITFTPYLQNQRPALLLSNGNIYIAFASFGDNGSYSGWVFDYNATTLKQSAIYNNTPDGELGGIWQSGNGLSADSSGNVYLSSGNGTFTTDGSNLGNSVVKLSSNLTPIDWFTPYNSERLNELDNDLGSGGVLLIPNTNYIIAGGKEGKIYLLDRNNMGKFHAGGDTQILQSFQATGRPVNKVNTPTGTHNIHGTPIYWNGPNGALIYVWGENDWARAYSFNGTTLNPTPVATSTMTVPDGMPGAMLSLSANGSTNGTGILWTSAPFDRDATHQTVNGILRAFDATTMTEIWNSKEDVSRDDVGNFAKFSPPTIANGKVYLSTFSGELAVYGLDT